MNILVTGGTGFLGKYVIPLLLSRGHSLTAIVRSGAALPGCTVIQADVENPKDLERSARNLEGADTLVHLAAIIPGTVPGESEEEMERSNVRATQHLFAVLPESVRHIVFASTLDVYGRPQFLPLTEEHPTHPTTSYARSKLLAERWLTDACAKERRLLTILRFTQLYGPGERPIKAIPRFMEAVAQHESPVLFGDGSEQRDYLHVSDAAEAIALAVERRVEGVFNIASGTSVSVRDVLRTILTISGTDLTPTHRPRQKEAFDITFDIRKATERLSFHPNIPLEEGLMSTYRAISLAR